MSGPERRVVILGAGGREFHDFNVVYRHDPATRIVAFTAAQIPGIADRRYPPSLAGPSYPDGIPIAPEEDLTALIRAEDVDEVVLAYSDLSAGDVVEKASLALATGASFRLSAPASTMIQARRPVVAVCAVRTGCGKSQTSRAVARLVRAHGLRPVLVRHPMPYGDLEVHTVQRFATIDDVEASSPTIEEREEFEEPVRDGVVVYAGVDYELVLRQAEDEADVLIWDGGNNDLPFFAPDLHITLVDALRPGHAIGWYPGEVNLRMADLVVVTKADAAGPVRAAEAIETVRRFNPDASVVETGSPVTLDPGPDLTGRRVLVVEDGPTTTHGGMPYGAGLVAAREAGAIPVDPRPHAVGSLAETYRRNTHLGPVLPAMGYSEAQRADLEATVRATCDAEGCEGILSGTPVNLGAFLDFPLPVRRVRYGHADHGHPTLDEILAPHLHHWRERHGRGAHTRDPRS